MIEEQKQKAQEWFCSLRNKICAEFEQIEGEIENTDKTAEPGKFQRKKWQREGGGGGEISLMKGKVFEKVGVNISTVYGEFSEEFRKEMPNAKDMPYFWASGISLVAHMCSPKVPAVHMNTRMIVVSDNKNNKSWFGGGADLTPMQPLEEDTKSFHEAFKTTCDKFDSAYYDKFKKWCDEYFYLKHRSEARGVGGIFYDYLNTGNHSFDFDFTKAVGETFLQIYPQIVRKNYKKTWEIHEREQQLIKRGRYVEFNLLYDRGTRFGLMTGGNTEAILMSLPPEVKWP